MTVPFPRDPDPNTDLLLTVAKYIEENPERYNQGWFANPSVCGTACCIAGTALILSGFKPDLYVSGLKWTDMRTGVHVDTVSTAQALLNIGDATADVLFDAIWRPIEGMSVPDALRALSDGAHLAAITDSSTLGWYGVYRNDDDNWHIDPVTYERHAWVQA